MIRTLPPYPRAKTPLPTALALMASLAASPVAAEALGAHHCSFARECVAGHACGAAAFDIVLRPQGDGHRFTMESLTGTTHLHALTNPAERPFTLVAAGGVGLAELLTVEADGTALLSVHIFDETAQAVTYFGRCEDAE